MKVLVRKRPGADSIPLVIHTEWIRLDNAMKLANLLPSGGMAKQAIQSGAVQVNGQVCCQRGKKLFPGDTIAFDGKQYQIDTHER